MGSGLKTFYYPVLIYKFMVNIYVNKIISISSNATLNF